MSQKPSSREIPEVEVVARELDALLTAQRLAEEAVEDYMCTMHDDYHWIYESIAQYAECSKSWAFKLARRGRTRRKK